MKYHRLEIDGLVRELPVVSLTPKIKVASVNLLGDIEMVDVIAKKIVNRIKGYDFDSLVGPEVKVVPLLHELSKLMGKPNYVVCRKQIYGYMVKPIKTRLKPGLVLDGSDTKVIEDKKVIVIDDVVSSGRTLRVVGELMDSVNAEVVTNLAVFKQGDIQEGLPKNFIFMEKLPIIKT
jgi:adenine phosphoribosyltransferase